MKTTCYFTQHSTLSSQPRRGVTLIELLVVMLIISMLAALVLGVAAVAGETAREQHSKHVVQRLHTLLMDHYNSFKNRRVRLNPAIEQKIANDGSLNTAAKKGRARAKARLWALRELMVLEVPDRWSDIMLTAIPTSPSTTAYLKPMYLDPASLSRNGRTDLGEAFLRRYQSLVGRTNTVTGQPNTGDDLRDFQGAECLYMIVTMACGDGEARTLFGENSIGDVDGDGAPEFVDGWNRPIQFLRWAPGFESQIQIDANTLGPVDPVVDQDGGNQNWDKAASGDHDPFDLFRVDSIAYRLVPLIFSGGRDEDPGLRIAKPIVTWTGVANPTSISTITPLSPFFTVDDNGDQVFLGTAYGTERYSTDNVHNHLLGKR